MTKAAGDATSISAPYTSGTYKLFVVNSKGVIIGESNAKLKVSGSATPPPSGPVTPTPTPGPRSAFVQNEAEDFDSQYGIQLEDCSEGGQDVAYIEDGDYIVFKSVDFGNGAESFQARVASAGGGGNIEIRLDSITGPLVGTCKVVPNGEWQSWINATCDVSGVRGKHDLYLKFTGGSGYLFNLNWWKFVAAAAAPTPTPATVNSVDVDKNGVVNMADVILVASAFNTVQGDAKFVESYDLNSDGAINMADIVMIAAKFGTIL